MAEPASEKARARGCLCPEPTLIARDCPLHQWEYEQACESGDDWYDEDETEEVEDDDDDAS